MFGFDKKALKMYENELNALKKVADHHHLIKVRGTYTDRKYLVMLLEPVADENLKEYMNRGGPRNTEEQARFRTYFGCLANTIRFLHDPSIEILHKDIKPENILIKDGHLILTDFGTAFDWSKTGQSMTRSNAEDVRTPRYQSPEVANGEFHRSSDIWSLGVVFLEMVTVLRGKTLKQMEEFLVAHGKHVIPIHENLDAALNWFEALQEHPGGSPIDNEPLIWIKVMLNRVPHNRPTADELYDKTVAFGGVQFCGRCCLDGDSDSDDYEDMYSDSHMLSDDPEAGCEPSTLPIPPSPPPRAPHHEDSHSEASKVENDNERVPGYLPAGQGDEEEKHMFGALPSSPTSTKEEKNEQRASEIDKLPETAAEKVHRPKKSSAGGSRASSVRQDTPRGQGHAQNTLPTKAQIPVSKTHVVRVKPDPFPDRGFIKSWLAALPAKFATPASQVRPRATKAPVRRPTLGPSIGSQRMQHFLSSLPEEPADFEHMSGEFSAYQQPTPPVSSSTIDSALPTFSNRPLERSKSFENFQTSSHILQEEADDDQFSDMPKSRLVHYASANNLDLELELSKKDLQEATKELKNFKTVIAGLVKKKPAEAASAPPPKSTEPTVEPPIAIKPVSEVSVESESAVSGAGQLLQNSLRESMGQPPLAAPTPIPAARMENTSAPPVSTNPTVATPPSVSDSPSSSVAAPSSGPSSPSSNSAASPSILSSVSSKIAALASVLSSPSLKTPPTTQPASLGSFIAKVPLATQRRHWEPASIIMKRIMDNKTSVAPTSEMSAKTRAFVSKGRFMMQWNDRCYNYLPYFVAQAKVGGVRELLMAGCNPGTREKPRWSPAYNAVMGKTDKHTKCLQELAAYSVNVNATRSSNGRTFLHYAIEHEPWSGYSTVIYVLLTAGANPNVRDNAGDLPLLMLLVGTGPLPQEKRDALYLLLAPNFTTSLEVCTAGTLDNPLHLAIRRKDAYTVDALLTKMDTVSAHVSSVLQLMHRQNASGFTPLLLAFKLFNFTEDADDELQIIKLLLEKGANANDQDATQGETPLHLVISGSKNAIALEFLCRHSADPRKQDKAGKCPIDLVHNGETDHPNNKWYSFARRRLENVLTADDYRPPELVALLAEEAERAATTSKAGTN
jgi:serine/threonine protein kinase/ankyrin repeat protein